MSKNVLKNIIEKTNKLHKENHQKVNTKFGEKFIKFSYESKGSFEQNFEFKSNGNFVEILLKYNGDSVFNFDVVFNDIVIEKFENVESGEHKYYLHCKGDNCFKLYVYAENENLINFQIFVKGCIEKYSKDISKLLFCNNNYYFNNNKILSASNDIMSSTMYNNKISNDNTGRTFDINYGYSSSINLKNEILHIYCDVSLKLKNINNGVEYNLGEDVDSACIVSAQNTDRRINVFCVKNGVVSVSNYLGDMTLVGVKKLDEFDNKKIVKISSIISDDFSDYLLVKNSDDLWYLVWYNFNENCVGKITPFVRCEDLKLYYSDGGVISIEKVESGIIVKRYTNFLLVEKIFENEFLNVEDALYYDNKIYLINSNNIQVVEI